MGFGSRREIESQIEQGLVKVNGKVIAVGTKVSEGDRVQIGSKQAVINGPDIKVRVLVYNKPVGEVCTRKDEKDRVTVFDHLPNIKGSRWISIGRLDINTSGLLLFTNHGELANRLMHPSGEVEREYAVRVNGVVTEAIVKKLQHKVLLEDGPAHFDSIVDAGGQGSNHWYHVVLREGRNREVRRLWEACDIRVSRLTRVRYGNIALPRNLRQGKTAEMSFDEVKLLMDSVGLKLEYSVKAKKTRFTNKTGKRTGKRTGKPAGKQATRSRQSRHR